jgi:hypothetical protein
MRTNRSFVEPGDQSEVGDEVVYHGEHDNLVQAIVAERAATPLAGITRCRIVDYWSEVDDPDAGRWIGHDRLHGIYPLRSRGEAL